MLCQSCEEQLQECVKEGLLSEEQWTRIRERLGQDAAPATRGGGEALKTFNPIMAMYYFGALLILSAFGWFLQDKWDALGPAGVLGVSLLYAGIFLVTGRKLFYEEGFPIAGGLLISCAVGMTPLTVWAAEKLLGIWPQGDPGSFSKYYPMINGSWVIMELATILAALWALRKVRFSFLFMPAAIALWFLSMDLAEIVLSSHDISWEQRSWVSVVVGLLILAMAGGIELKVASMDAFWVYLAGLMSFWGGLTSLPSHGELGRVAYFAINLALIAIGLRLNRRTFAVFGVAGVYAYLGHLASLFKGSPIFPLILALAGILMIFATVLFQKNYGRLRKLVGAGSG